MSLIGITVLGPLGCQGGDEATSVERPQTTTVVTTTAPPEQPVLTPEERLLGWIRSCEVRRMVFTHEHGVYIGFTNGGTVRLRIKESAEDKLLAALSGSGAAGTYATGESSSAWSSQPPPFRKRCGPC